MKRISRRFFAFAAIATLALGLAAPVSAQGLLGSLFAAPPVVDSFSSGGCDVTVEQFWPKGCGPFPAVVVLHGSDGLCENGAAYRAVCRQITAEGAVALLVHYWDRGGEPTDPDHPGDNHKQFRVWVKVAQDAARYAKSLPNVCKDRIGQVGFSLGAFVGLSAAANNHLYRAVIEVSGGLPEEYAKDLTYMPPTLILHGAQDEEVSVKEATSLVSRMKAHGHTYRWKIYDCEGHKLSDAAQKDAAERGECFFNDFLM
ncbi:MAG: dienelactone hydrolase family protein [Candidatus Sumerlaeaceae bacterium]|nr:dienelactone hydrolase family protein [Candidatus Sumerlaeaceae bacterium]